MQRKPFILMFLMCAFLLCFCVINVALCESAIEIMEIYNFFGDKRFVKISEGVASRYSPNTLVNEIKLFLTEDAVAKNNPTQGFKNQNSFTMSCGPDAALNLFRWYGINDIAANTCTEYTTSNPLSFVHEDYDFGDSELLPPGTYSSDSQYIVRNCDHINAIKLGGRMKTNRWWVTIGVWPFYYSHKCEGTSTTNFRNVTRNYVKRYATPYDYIFHYDYGSKNMGIEKIRSLLAEGNPVVVNFKTGDFKGHFALIVGIEYPANSRLGVHDPSTKIFIANNRPRTDVIYKTWKEFGGAWKRDYMLAPFSTYISSLLGEEPYTMIYLAHKDWASPMVSGGGSDIIFNLN